MTPFKVLYGYSPNLRMMEPESTAATTIADWMEGKKKWNSLIKNYLIKAQKWMKQMADKNRIERSFKLGDLVFLKLHPHRQSSVNFRRNLKLTSKFYGPYKVLQKIGNIAYRLELPQGQLYTQFSMILCLNSLLKVLL